MIFARATIECMITFHQLGIGTGSGCACALCARSEKGDAHPAPFADIQKRIIAIAPQAVMIDGFEPFMHPDLVRIVTTLTASEVRRIGMRTDGGALSNPQTAQGCIDAGVRVFEIPLLSGSPEKSARLSATPGLHEASLRGIVNARERASHLGVEVFICAHIALCSHNMSHLVDATQTALSAGVNAVRVSYADRRACEKDALVSAHTLATQAGVAFFGDECDACIDGVPLYEVIA